MKLTLKEAILIRHLITVERQNFNEPGDAGTIYIVNCNSLLAKLDDEIKELQQTSVSWIETALVAWKRRTGL